jgi:ferredoxin-NADP reductase
MLIFGVITMMMDKPSEIREMSGNLTKALITVRIDQITYEATGILRYAFVSLDGEPLERFSAGAHIDVHVQDGVVRQYSLCSNPLDTSRYEIAVLCDEKGRGGSKALHNGFRAGDIINISTPRNHFPLNDRADRHLLLAGGIGVTPMIAMIHELETRGETYELHYCTRTSEATAFKTFLAPMIEKGSVHLHHDNGDPLQGLNIADLLKNQQEGTHLYYCGPTGFMEAVKSASEHWQKGTVHFEYFSAPADNNADKGENKPFTITLKRSGTTLEVPSDKSIVDVLREHGHYVDTSCEDGFCGTCMTRFSGGEPDHRDTVLDDEDRESYLLICCSRAKSENLDLDI